MYNLFWQLYWYLFLVSLATVSIFTSVSYQSTGATGAYTRQFEQMESDLLEIQTILDSASISNSELVDLKQRIDLASDMLMKTTTNLTR